MFATPLTRQQVRQVDQLAITKYGMSGLVLMENAGRGAAEIIAQLVPQGDIVILCGRGNNAGDGFVIARHLELLDRQPKLVSLAAPDTLRGDAARNSQIAQLAQIPYQVVHDRQSLAEELATAQCIVECLLGTGAVGAPRGLFADGVQLANQSSALRIAIDIPTGLDCDSGEAHDPTFMADHTITFVAPKVGFTENDAALYVGQLHLVGIGVPRKLLDAKRFN